MAALQTCRASGKRRFRDHKEAIQALHHAQNARHWAIEDERITKRQERRTYECNACHGWHLTSSASHNMGHPRPRAA